MHPAIQLKINKSYTAAKDCSYIIHVLGNGVCERKTKHNQNSTDFDEWKDVFGV